MAFALAVVACSDPPFQSIEPRGTGGTENTGRSGAGGKRDAVGGTGASTPLDDAGPSAGGAGPGDAAGAAGDGGGPECVTDSDCAAVTCNGTPRCNAGRCEPGEPCENPDPEHCAVSCVRSGDRASCEVQGKDGDGDGHLDAACSSGGGDDCNDANADVHGGAVERCDGLDNDCDGKMDLDDGLELPGEPKRVYELTGTASLGIAPSPKGFGVLALERQTARLSPATRADVLFIDPTSQVASIRLSGEFTEEPTIGFAGQFYVYDDNAGAPRLQRFGWRDGKIQTLSMGQLPPSAGRSFYAFESPDPVLVTVDQHEKGSSLQIWSNVPELGGFATYPLVMAALPIELRRPAYDSRGYVWVQSSDLMSGDHQLSLMFRAFASPHQDRTLQLVDVKADDTSFYSALRYDTLRPQLIWTGTDQAVGWMSEAGLGFVRFTEAGDEICRTEAIPGLSWGWINSLAHLGSAVYASVVTSQGEPALIRLDDACNVSAPIPLSPRHAKVARGEDGLFNGKPFLEVGHPVISTITVDGKSRPGIAWVEERGTSGLYPVMFRYLGDQLCN